MTSLNRQLSRLSTTARIALVAVILIPLLLVGVLLLLANRQPAPYTGQIDAVAFNRAIADGDARLAEGNYEAAISSCLLYTSRCV